MTTPGQARTPFPEPHPEFHGHPEKFMDHPPSPDSNLELNDLENMTPLNRERTSSIARYLNLDPDKLLNTFGKFGRFQMRVYFITHIVSLLYVMNMMVMPFITEDPKFFCDIKEPEGVQWTYEVVDKCTVLDSNNWTIQCANIPNSQYVYESRKESLASEFDLVCNDYASTEHASALFLLGGMLASAVVTQLADICGRKITFLAPLYLSVACNILSFFSPNYVVFCVLRFISGFGTTGFIHTAFILCTESVSSSFRTLMPVLGALVWVLGYSLAGVAKMLIKEWRYVYLAISAPGLITIFFYKMVPESLHWLIHNQKHRKVKNYISQVNRVNRMTICLEECRNAGEESETPKPKRTIIDVFTHRGLFVQLLLNAFVIAVMNGTYWGLSLFSTELTEDKWLGYFLSGLVELPAGLIGTFLMVHFPRRIVSFLSLFLQGISMLCALYIPGSPTLLLIFPLAAKVFNGLAWAVQPLIISELAPTTVRNVFSGSVAFIGEVGSVGAPYLKRLEAWHPSAPNLIISSMSIVAACLILLMPETKDTKLPEDLANMDWGPLRRFVEKKAVDPTPVHKEEAHSLLSTIKEESPASERKENGKAEETKEIPYVDN